MGNDVEELLRDGMRRATAGVAMPPDLAGRLATRAAGQRRRRRWRTRAGITATAAVAAAAGFLVTGAVNSGGTPAPRVQTVGYVLGHVNHALDGLDARPTLAYVRSSWAGPDGERAAYATWLYNETATRHVLLRQSLSSSGRVTQAQRIVLTITHAVTWQVAVVNYPDRTWFARTFQRPGLFFRQPSCRTPDTYSLFDSGAALYQLVQCGDFIRVARQRLNGVPVIELVPAAARLSPFTETLWVDAATYLPVRIRVVGPRGWVAETGVRWLPATSANLAHLTLRIPAGFKRTATP